MSNYKFGFDVASLASYTNYIKNVNAKAIYGAATIASGIEVIPGQKGNISLTTLTNDLYLQLSSCGWTVSGNTNLDPVNITLCSLDYKEQLCIKDLEPKWLSQMLKEGNDPTNPIPFIDMIVNSKIDQLKSEVDYIFWQGNTSTGTGNLVLCNGIEKYLSGKTCTYVATASGTTTAANVIAHVNAMVAAIPGELLNATDLVLYMSPADNLIWKQAIISANLYNPDQILPLPIEVIPIPGLRGTNKWYLTSKKNIVFVTDLLDETEDLKIVDNPFGTLIGYIQIFGSLKMGVGVYFPEFVVTNNPILA